MTGDSKGVCPFRGGACEGAGALCRSRDAGFRADPATECDSTPTVCPFPQNLRDFHRRQTAILMVVEIVEVGLRSFRIFCTQTRLVS